MWISINITSKQPHPIVSFLLRVFFVCFVRSTLNDSGIFICSYPKWFAFDTFSEFITNGLTAAFLFLFTFQKAPNYQRIEAECWMFFLVHQVKPASFPYLLLSYSGRGRMRKCRSTLSRLKLNWKPCFH